MTHKRVQWGRIAAGLVITSVCLWRALLHMQLEDVGGVLRRINWAWLFVALLALTSGYAARIYRWWWMLRVGNPEIMLRSCVGPFIGSIAVNNVVPFRAGDALRVLGFKAQLHTPAARVLGSLVVERVLDLTVLLSFLLEGIVGLQGTIPAMYSRVVVFAVVAALLCWTVLLFIGTWLEPFLLKLCQHKAMVARGWAALAEKLLRQLVGMLTIVGMPHRALKLIAMSAVVWTCEGVVFVAVASGVQYDGRPYGPWFALALGSLSTLIPSAPGYVGTFDLSTLSALTLYGASTSVAGATTLTVHSVLWLPLTGAGLMYLLISQMRARRQQVIGPSSHEQERV